MAIFGIGKKKKDEVKKTSEKEGLVLATAAGVSSESYDAHVNLSGVLIRQRITEKATDLAAHNVYVFDIDPRAKSREVAQAVSSVYKVVPLKVSIVPIVSKTVFVRGKKGRKAGGRKAYVYLKKGDKIEIA